MSKKKVVVAMSGGVDSSVAAAMLIEQGYDVIGVTMQIWPESEKSGDKSNKTCCSLTAVEDARRVAAKLGIPHYVMNFQEIFQKTVIDNFIDEYREGRTPNPCIRCNKFVKFETLLSRALAMGADCIATGHYARIEFDSNKDRWLLKKGIDNTKDQSYALYGMTQDQLMHTLMPLGGIPKSETRSIAAELGLSVAKKPESQDICFVENKDYPGFLKEYIPEIVRPGAILDINRNEIGRHQGIAFYTLGQRKRIGVTSNTPIYVINIDPENNIIIVGKESDLYASTLEALKFNFVSRDYIPESIAVSAKIRYNMIDAPAILHQLDASKYCISFNEPQRAITPGQSVVCYDGDEILGGGIISRAL
ncbi:MAG: tRNA 2-thiouridine(34) synthase MnmA [Armatimonadota bacterium]